MKPQPIQPKDKDEVATRIPRDKKTDAKKDDKAQKDKKSEAPQEENRLHIREADKNESDSVSFHFR